MIKTEWQYLGPNRKRFIFFTSFFIIAGLIHLLSPWLIGTIFNSIQGGQITTEAELTKLFFMISLLLVIHLGFWIFHGTARIAEQLTAFHTHKNYTNSKIKKTVELPVEWHKDNHSGDTIDRINKARLSLYSYTQHDSFQLIYTLVNIFGSLAIIFFISPKVGLFSLLSCSSILYTTMKLDKKIKKIHKNINKFDHKLSASVFDYFSNIITVITLRLKKTVRSKLSEKLEASHKDYKKATYLIEIKWGLASIAIKAMAVIVLIYQAYTDFHATGIILIGTLFMLYSYLDKVGNSFFNFAQFYGSMTKKAADIEAAEPIDEAFDKIKDKLKTTLPKDWKTIISSIHRLHLLDKFDYIYMFDKGNVIGQGTFEEIKNNPKFRRIWNRYVSGIKK